MKKYIASLMLLTFASHLSASDELMPLDELYPQVEQFLYAQIPEYTDARVEVKVKPLDSRITVGVCSEPLEIFSPFGSSASTQRVTVGVRCGGHKPWTLYLPAQVSIMKEVQTINRTVNAREMITQDMLSSKVVNITSIDRGFFDDPKLVIGKVTRQPLRSGQVLSTHHLSDPKIVTRGQLVSIKAVRPQFTIQTQAKALQDGGFGQRIQVQNLSSKRVIEGTISGPGEIQIH